MKFDLHKTEDRCKERVQIELKYFQHTVFAFWHIPSATLFIYWVYKSTGHHFP